MKTNSHFSIRLNGEGGCRFGKSGPVYGTNSSRWDAESFRSDVYTFDTKEDAEQAIDDQGLDDAEVMDSIQEQDDTPPYGYLLDRLESEIQDRSRFESGTISGDIAVCEAVAKCLEILRTLEGNRR